MLIISKKKTPSEKKKGRAGGEYHLKGKERAPAARQQGGKKHIDLLRGEGKKKKKARAYRPYIDKRGEESI